MLALAILENNNKKKKRERIQSVYGALTTTQDKREKGMVGKKKKLTSDGRRLRKGKQLP